MYSKISNISESLAHLISSKMCIHSVTNSAVCSSDRHNSSAVALFGTIFIGEIEQNRQY